MVRKLYIFIIIILYFTTHKRKINTFLNRKDDIVIKLTVCCFYVCV